MLCFHYILPQPHRHHPRLANHISNSSCFDGIKSLYSIFKRKWLIALLIIVTSLASVIDVLYFTAKFVKFYFGAISLEQILINVGTADSTSKELASKITHAAFPFVIKAILVLVAIWTLAIDFMLNRCWYRDLKRFVIFVFNLLKSLCVTFVFKHQAILFILVLCVLSVAGFKYIDRNFHVVSFFSASNSNFVEENFARLNVSDAQFKDGNKRNLILLFLESMEYGYSDPRDYKANLIPELKRIADSNIRVSGYKKTQGGYFTLDGICAQTLGVPLTQLPIDIHSGDGHKQYDVLLGGVDGIFNLLKKQGYETSAFIGTSRNFTHKGDFMNAHGIDHVFSAETWNERGYTRNAKNLGNWDFNDDFVLDRIKEYLKGVKKGDQPFALMMETVNTHFPKGWAPYPEDFANKGTYQDALMHSSKIVSDFYEWMKTQPWFQNTTVILLGDHPFQDFNGLPFTSFTTKAKNRETYIALINTAGGELKVRNCGFMSSAG